MYRKIILCPWLPKISNKTESIQLNKDNLYKSMCHFVLTQQNFVSIEFHDPPNVTSLK